jgi:cleavage stimulation factor subunit 2
VTDETITDIFSRVGQVISYRALTDKETGKPRGYAFAEYSDADAAASAVRNLNDYEIQGRKLRVDYANEKNEKDEAPQPHVPTGIDGSGALPPLPPGRDLGPSLTVEDAISKTLNTLPPSQLLDILQQMQTLVTNDPVRAQALLDQSPQLSYAIFQALLLLKLVDTTTLTQIIQATSNIPAQNTPAPQAYQPPPALAPAPAPVPQPAYPQAQPYPVAYPPQSYPATATPVAQPYQAPTPQPTQPALAADPNKAALIQQVLAMSQQQIDALDPVSRNQILMLRSQLMQGRPL